MIKSVLIFTLLTISACATKPPTPEQIPAPTTSSSVDNSQLDVLTTRQLVDKYSQHLRQMAHVMSKSDADKFVQSSLDGVRKKYEQDDSGLRRYIVDELKMLGRNVPIEIIIPAGEPPRHFAAAVMVQCTLDFNDPNALGNLVDQAKFTFAVWSQSGPTSCTSGNGSGCWIYKQNCGLLGDLRYEEFPFGAYNHFHLSFEDLDCVDFTNGGFGREQADGSCSSAGVDYRNENRFANGHVNNHVQRLWVEDDGEAAIFSADRVRVRGEVPAYISFKKQDGTWWAWRNLEPNYYNIGEWVNDVVEMRFRGGADSTQVTGIDDVRVRRFIVSEPPTP